ncbi:SDR family NAD(P)-dependent oxidoreductase [Streptosporangium sp. NBC_01639]|uniref:SDR family NAD(P)-dependent oxidoreductase n=1 Tax=Streptosporangium sp. NBC_01639 TaxID=2975948 RepID=UPI00386648ED|nr:SDR family NAD(P)-dependent oxidoreductase [Streptosporangium sp. NBC_01639]
MDSETVSMVLRALGEARRLPMDDPDRKWIAHAALALVRDGQQRRKQDRGRDAKEADAAVLAATVMGSPGRVVDAPLPERPVGEPAGELRRPRRCYVCKDQFTRVGNLYHLLCPSCAAFNAARRTARADLSGRRALITGGRTKIGHQLALKMLRDGAHVTVTTRFPADAVRRFAESGDWGGRLEVVGIDLCDPRQVIALGDRFLAAGDPLDILVNNAAQTLRRPLSAYAALVEGERDGLPPGASTVPGFLPGAVPGLTVPLSGGGNRALPDLTVPSGDGAWDVSPSGDETRGLPVPTSMDEAERLRVSSSGGETRRLPVPTSMDEAERLPVSPSGDVNLELPDVSGLLLDPSARNSWSVRIGEIDPAELLEVQLINAVAPFLLIDRLLPLLREAPFPRRYIVNVSAVEGQFAVPNKTGRHPHTNMAKAGLNMLTRTSAADLAQQGVYMCGVDTGWITDENPVPVREWLDRRTPLDVIDGAARVYDPIVRGEAGDPVHGVFLKDYAEAPW